MTVSFHLQQNIDYVNHISETILYNQFIISRINTLLCTMVVYRHIRSRPRSGGVVFSSSSWKKGERAAEPKTLNTSSATELNYTFASRDRSETH